MWSEIVKQLLTLSVALLGAVLGVVFGTWFIPGQDLAPRVWLLILTLGLVVAFLVVCLVAEARSIERQVRLVGRRIRTEIDAAATLEYNARDGRFNSNADFEAAIEDWRTCVNGYLARALPDSGADIRFRTGIGEVGPGRAYEHTRLKDLKQNLLAVLDMLPSYVQRSR